MRPHGQEEGEFFAPPRAVHVHGLSCHTLHYSQEWIYTCVEASTSPDVTPGCILDQSQVVLLGIVPRAHYAYNAIWCYPWLPHQL